MLKRTATATIGASGNTSTSLAFRYYHPAVPAVVFACILVFSMASFHPVLCTVSLLGALAFGLVCRGAAAVGKSLLWAVPLFVLVALLNPFFSAMGTTQVGSLLGYPLYQESLAYGACMGVMMCSTLVWMQNAAAVITMEDTLALVGKAAPVVALMMSMIARLLPSYMARGQHLAQVQAANTCAPVHGLEATKQATKRFGTLLSWSMEDSLTTADSMLARGWNTKQKRSAYTRARFSGRDGAALIVVVALGLASAFGAWHVSAGFSFYPQISPVQFTIGMVPFALLMFAPCVFEGLEVLAWRR